MNGPHFLLDSLAISAEANGDSTGVSLLTAGGLVTGTLVSTRRYLDAVADEFRQSGDSGADLAELIEGLAGGLVMQDRQPDPTQDVRVYCLIEARMALSDGRMTPPRALTVDPKQVAGFMLGTVSAP